MSRIAGVVLAAGISRRFGRPKQLARLGDRTMIERIVDIALASAVDEVAVVLGAHADDARTALGEREVRIVVNERYEEGQGTSLAAGIRALPGDVDAAVILLGDQPGVDPRVIDRVMTARRTSGASIVMAEYGLERGHPVLFGREHFPALVALDGDHGGREVIRQHTDDVAVVPADRESLPPDIDTEDDWRAMIGRGP